MLGGVGGWLLFAKQLFTKLTCFKNNMRKSANTHNPVLHANTTQISEVLL